MSILWGCESLLYAPREMGTVIVRMSVEIIMSLSFNCVDIEIANRTMAALVMMGPILAYSGLIDCRTQVEYHEIKRADIGHSILFDDPLGYLNVRSR